MSHSPVKHIMQPGIVDPTCTLFVYARQTALFKTTNHRNSLSLLLSIDTSRSSTAQSHFCSHPQYFVRTRKPIWSLRPHRSMTIGTICTIETQCCFSHPITSTTSTPRGHQISSLFQRRVFSQRRYPSTMHWNGSENSFTTRFPSSCNKFIMYLYTHLLPTYNVDVIGSPYVQNIISITILTPFYNSQTCNPSAKFTSFDVFTKCSCK